MKNLKWFPGKSILASLFILSICFFAFTTPASSPATTGTGIRSYARQAANLPVTSSTTPVNTDLTFAIAANQKAHCRFVVPVTLAGTASGLKFLVDAPATPTNFNSSLVVFADDATLGLVSVITSEAAQGVTLANAGNHLVIIEFDIVNGSTAGNVTLQFAQNVSDAGAATVLQGAYADINKL